MKTAEEYLREQLSEFPNHEEYNQKAIDAISDFMQGYAKHYHEQQVKNCLIADVGETLSKQDFQKVMTRELEGFREMNIFDVDDEAGKLLASSIWDDHKVIER